MQTRTISVLVSMTVWNLVALSLFETFQIQKKQIDDSLATGGCKPKTYIVLR